MRALIAGAAVITAAFLLLCRETGRFCEMMED